MLCLDFNRECRKCNICEHFRSTDANQSNKKEIDLYINEISLSYMDFDTIRLLKKILDYSVTLKINKIPVDIIKEYAIKMNWNHVSMFQYIDENIITDYGHLIEENRIDLNFKEFNIIKFMERLEFDDFKKFLIENKLSNKCICLNQLIKLTPNIYLEKYYDLIIDIIKDL